LIKVRTEDELKTFIKRDIFEKMSKDAEVEKLAKTVMQQFSNLFNSYAKHTTKGLTEEVLFSMTMLEKNK
jgi:hypothetical protein